MTRIEFRRWRSTLRPTQQVAVDLIVAERVYSSAFKDAHTTLSEVRQYAYDTFPEWHGEGR